MQAPTSTLGRARTCLMMALDHKGHIPHTPRPTARLGDQTSFHQWKHTTPTRQVMHRRASSPLQQAHTLVLFSTLNTDNALLNTWCLLQVNDSLQARPTASLHRGY